MGSDTRGVCMLLKIRNRRRRRTFFCQFLFCWFIFTVLGCLQEVYCTDGDMVTVVVAMLHALGAVG